MADLFFFVAFVVLEIFVCFVIGRGVLFGEGLWLESSKATGPEESNLEEEQTQPSRSRVHFRNNPKHPGKQRVSQYTSAHQKTLQAQNASWKLSWKT